MPTLRTSIVDAINELHPLLNADIPDAEKHVIRKRLSLLYAQLEEVIAQSISADTEEFNQAIAALQETTQSAKDARQDLDKIAQVINKTAKALEKLEKVVNMGLRLVG